MSTPPEPAPAEPEAEKKKAPEAKPKRRPGEPLGYGGLVWALMRRPAPWIVGILLVGLAGLIRGFVGPSAESAVTLATYAPFLAGAWAVYAATGAGPHGMLPPKRRALTYGSTALVVAVLSGIAEVTLTAVGGLIVRTAFALGPMAALAEGIWPPQSLWKGILVIDDRPKEFAIMAAGSLGAALVFRILMSWLLTRVFGVTSEAGFLEGVSRGVGWVVISAVWMRFYLASPLSKPAT